MLGLLSPEFNVPSEYPLTRNAVSTATVEGAEVVCTAQLDVILPMVSPLTEITVGDPSGSYPYLFLSIPRKGIVVNRLLPTGK